ncbi:MAG TPA: glycoside hydrolase domain-containing protein, partial [Vicinamibacteria bacterium]|nr:glycoside hydrolase domain-containing protein [Vicinamibacteria bacterium]
MRPRSLVIVGTVAVALAAGGEAAPAAVGAWPVDALVKVFPADRPPSGPAAAPELVAARGQHVGLQVALRSSTRLDGVAAECRPLEGPGGSLAADVRLHAVGLVVVGSRTDDVPDEELVGEAPGFYPDPLLDLPLTLEPGRTRSVWASIHVPEEAPPGAYRSAVVVRSDGRELARVPFRLRVAAGEVPAQRTLRVTNWFRVDDRHAKQFWGAPQFSDAWWNVVGNLARVMAEYRQNVVLTPTLDLVELLPGEGAGFGFERFDRWVETFRRAGAVGFIEGEHLVGRAGGYDEPLVVPVLLREGERVRKAELPLEDPRVEPFLDAFLPALNRHLDEKGWKPIYLQHVLDEPHGDEPTAYARAAALVRRHLPGVPTIDAIDAHDVPDALRDASDVWVPQLGRFDDQMALLAERQRAGHEVWFYTCLFPRGRYMNRLMDQPLLKTRLLHWLGYRYSLTGFLHWGWNFWGPEPTKDTQPVINLNQTLLPSGDAFIVYPDRAR